MGDILTTCVYCGCGCGLYLHEDNGIIHSVSPSRNHPVSRGNLCVKGWHIQDFIHSSERLTQPLIRENGTLIPATWNEALDYTATELRRIRKEGLEFGALSSAKCTNEENYLLQKFTRAVMQTNNIDHCARL